MLFGILFISFSLSFGQTNLQFTSVNVTPERAVQLHWSSQSNEVYEIDYANALATNDDGTTAWFPLATDYPAHQGTNTFWLDTGNYLVTPVVPHPKYGQTRFYRVMLRGVNTAASNPTVAITSPTNGDTVSGDLTISFNASSSDILADVKLYVDGQEIRSSDNGSNFVITTSEWWNGAHTLFLTAKSLSHFEGIPNDTSVTYGRAVSSYVTVNFSNLISEIAYSQPYFEPALGQTQEVTAMFAANCDWTLQILDVNGNAVRHASGSGNSLRFDWDGTGDGGTNIPDAVYHFLISATTNGLADEVVTNGGGNINPNPPPGPGEEMLWAASPDENVVPLAILPPGADTNGYAIFSATPAEVKSLHSSSRSSRTSLSKSGGHFTPMDLGANESAVTPNRPPPTPGKGTIGTFYVGYQDYWTDSGTFSTPPIPTGNPIVNKWVQLDGQANQTQAAQHETFGSILENKDVANGFAKTMRDGHWKGSVNPFILKTDVTGGAFNNANVGLLCCHASYGTTAESDGVTRSYLRFFNSFGQGPDFCRLDDCHFGGSGTNGLKFMAILACSVLQNTPYNSLHLFGRLPISEDLHLLLTTSTVASSAPTLGSLWAGNMLGTHGTNGVQTVKNSWFLAGHEAYLTETNHITITFRVAYWPDAINDYITDTDTSPSTGNPLDIQKVDETVFSNP